MHGLTSIPRGASFCINLFIMHLIFLVREPDSPLCVCVCVCVRIVNKTSNEARLVPGCRSLTPARFPVLVCEIGLHENFQIPRTTLSVR